MIDRAPKIELLAVHLHDHPVEMPLLVSKLANPRRTLLADIASEERAEPIRPIAHRLVRDVDPALAQPVHDIAEGERVVHIDHHRQADNLKQRVKVAERRGWDLGTGLAAALPDPA